MEDEDKDEEDAADDDVVANKKQCWHGHQQNHTHIYI
jgi:hypothetical protein